MASLSHRQKIVCAITMLCVLVVPAAVPTFAEKDTKHPDLSGTWKLNLKESGFSSKKNSPIAETLTITSDGLTIEMRQVSVVDGHEIVRTFVTDGQPHIFKDPRLGEVETAAMWERSTLVTVSGKHESWQPGKISTRATDRWDLSNDGRTLTDLPTRSGFSRQAYVYEKQ